jgi:hypothetical protein
VPETNYAAGGIGAPPAGRRLAIGRWKPFAPHLAVLILVLTGVAFLRPDLPADGLAEVNKDKGDSALEDQERELNTIQNHHAAWTRVVQEVIAGQLTLFQGAEQLCDLHTVNPYFPWQLFRETYSGGSDRERCCRQLIVLIQLDLARDPVRRQALEARLETELAGLVTNPAESEGTHD